MITFLTVMVIVLALAIFVLGVQLYGQAGQVAQLWALLEAQQPPPQGPVARVPTGRDERNEEDWLRDQLS